MTSTRRLRRLRLLPSLLLGLVLLVLACGTARAQDAADEDRAVVAGALDSAPVVLDGETLFRVRGVASLPAAKRAATVAQRIADLAADPAFSIGDLVMVEKPDRTEFVVGERLIFTLVEDDAELEGVQRSILAEVCLTRVRDAITAFRADRAPSVLLERSLLALGVAAALAVLVLLLLWVFRRVVAALERTITQSVEKVRIQSFSLLRADHVWGLVLALARVLRVAMVVAACVAFVQFALGLFPWTRLLSRQLAGRVLEPLTAIGNAIVGFIPNLIFLIVLVYVTRYVVRMIRVFFASVAEGVVKLAGFDAEWAWPTFRIVRLLVLAFALVVAFPYLPGSDSGAFRGVSLFLGVIFSLGSTSVIANVIAGYSMTYRKAFRVGDRIRIGDETGDVVETGLLVTRLRTPKNAEVVVPNSMILTQQVVNYSSLAREHGLLVHTTVGIGYEVPWRQVEAMLLQAARATPGLRDEPAPFVLQLRLGDYAVEYELNVACGDPREMPKVRTALHRNVLDVFNEYGVAIMTPSYVADPPDAKVVPREHWYDRPAEGRPDGSGD